MLSPEVNEAKQIRAERQTKQREATTVARLIQAEALTPGERLEFRAPSSELQAEIEPWLTAQDGRRWATWRDDTSKPLQWGFDGNHYSPTGLARHILSEAAGRTSQTQGPLYWVTEEGQTLVELASGLATGTEVPLDVHLSAMSPDLRHVYDAFDAAVMAIGPDVTRRSRVKSIKYYGARKLCDLLIHAEHLSVYIQGVDATQGDQQGVVVGGTPKYAHAQVRTVNDVPKVLPLLKLAFDQQSSATG